MVTKYDVQGESVPFIAGQKPVSLTPAWEGQKLPNDQLNLKGVTMSQAENPPKDRWKIVFFIFVLHGLGTLMPWNMFITAKSYFEDFKLTTAEGNATSYSSNFMQYVGFASQIPNVIFNWLNLFVHIGGDLTKRVVYSILFELVIFMITVVLAMMDTSAYPGAFFWITMTTIVLLSMANGIYQNTIYGMVAALPIKYTGAVVLGSNISGLFASLISIFSSYIFTSQRTSAIYYFITAILVLLFCFDTYFALPLNRFYRHYEKSQKKDVNKRDSISNIKEPIPYFKVFKQAFPQLLNVFLIFFVTLSVFPAVHSDIKPIDENFPISFEMFTPMTCFLTFNLFAMLGSLTTSWIKWPTSKYLWIPVVLRLAFLPLFLFCNYRPTGIVRTLPVLITNEWVYWLLAVIMSFTSGYLSSLGMMYTPQTVEPQYQVTAGMFAAAILITGIFSGILLSFLAPIVIANLS